MRKVFATKVWKFHPHEWPIMPFSLPGDYKRLLEDSNDSLDNGYYIAFIATQDKEKVAPQDLGRLLGIARFDSNEIIDSKTHVAPKLLEDPNNYNDNGDFKWPIAIKMKQAWEFLDKPYATAVINQTLYQNSARQAIPLDEDDTNAVLSLRKREVPVFNKESWNQNSPTSYAENDKSIKAKGPTRGPVPSSHSVSYERNAEGLAYVYAFRFDNSDIWKIGWAKDVRKRLNDINKHVPHEILKQEWQEYFFEECDSQKSARDTEQALLDLLKDKRTHGERVRCTEQELKNAWVKIENIT